MLTAECGDPNVARRNWSASFLEFGSENCVRDGRLFIDIEHPIFVNRFGQPFLVAQPVTRLQNSIPVFTQHNYRNCDLSCFTKDRLQRWVSIRYRRQTIRIQDHCRSSVSIWPNSSWMMWLIFTVSLRKRRSLPNVSIQGLFRFAPWARSLSASASETSARKGIPRPAATLLARRKIASGISKVVFIQ